jgi:CheY-like chemotaxis protein
MRELVREFLEGAGYQVLVARDVKEAIQVAMRHKGQLDLLLTDVVMPDLSGPQLAEHLQPFRPQMKVLYMSGYADALVANSTEGSGADLINKPFTEENLLRRLREVLEGRRL